MSHKAGHARPVAMIERLSCSLHGQIYVLLVARCNVRDHISRPRIPRFKRLPCDPSTTQFWNKPKKKIERKENRNTI